ncbi:gtp-binding protein di-ras2 [Lasius niger]|uniref:Gtp-binding protein di-ras2 n=1 Tax=Lasius niger TaxID=67767 RepID=A0A0J7KWI4_LASNI|nr:gtp-binding protein di-ras2 [Lasius niger]
MRFITRGKGTFLHEKRLFFQFSYFEKFRVFVSFLTSNDGTIHTQVGNKCDESPSVREVSMSEGAAEAANWGCGFLETSAKTNHNVDALFRDLLTLEKNRSVSLQPVQSNNAIRLKEKCAVM